MVTGFYKIKKDENCVHIYNIFGQKVASCFDENRAREIIKTLKKKNEPLQTIMKKAQNQK